MIPVLTVAGAIKAAQPFSFKESSEVSKAFQRVYKGPLRWPSVLQVDPGREFMGEVRIRTGIVDVHRDHGPKVTDKF